jgi:bacillopeptidase F
MFQRFLGSPVGSDVASVRLTTLRLAGILPVFSAGNNGPYPGTVGSPGSYPEALAVGAVDELKEPASFSSRGPSPWEEVKPEISAPGVQIRSTFPGGGYALSNGTSMAAPHVAGVVAILMQADPDLTPDEIESILLSSAEPLADDSPNNAPGGGW